MLRNELFTELEEFIQQELLSRNFRLRQGVTDLLLRLIDDGAVCWYRLFASPGRRLDLAIKYKREI